MTAAVSLGTATRVEDFFYRRIGAHLSRREQRESFATYAFGLLSDGDRKSVEPIASRATADPDKCEQVHDHLLHFVRDSPWNDHAVRREAAKYVIETLAVREPVTTWIIDDTGFLKQGSHSVGVQRQYTGTAGKIANCQLGVSLVVATATEQVPIDMELYLPESWTQDTARRKKARIPDPVRFKSRIDIALDLITRAVEDQVPGEIVLADSQYGESSEFRDTIEMFGLDYAVGVRKRTAVWLLGRDGERLGDPLAVEEIGKRLAPRAFRQLTWREGSRRGLSSRFALRRVRIARDKPGGLHPEQRKPVWLVIEWPHGQPAPTAYTLTTLPRRLSAKAIVRILKERWRTERAYQEMKDELGLDHFEGRSFPGWHHHVSVVLCCYAFVVSERVRHFSPTTRGSRRLYPVPSTA